MMTGYIALFTDLFRLPSRWWVALQSMTLLNLIQSIEYEAKDVQPLSLPPELVIRWVRRRVKYSKRWGNNRCLLKGLLLYRLLYRAGCSVTMHLGCKLNEDHLCGHCWIESSDLAEMGDFSDAEGNHVMISRSLKQYMQE